MNQTIEFTLSVNNCLGCRVCPQEKLSGAYRSAVRRMSSQDFRTILDKIPTSIRIDFSGFSEPYLHPDCGSFIILAVTRGHEVHVYSTLVGMRGKQAEWLAVHQPAHFRVHVPDRTHLKFPDALWIRQHQIFLTSGIRASYMAMDEPAPVIHDYLRVQGIAVELPQMLSRAGNLDLIPVRHLSGPIRCGAEKFHSNVVLPNGDVFVCCMDWALSMPVGNLLSQDYFSIYTRAEEYRLNQNPPENSICRSCEWACPA
jgi:radical SAM protein with 4Fe4S-binding SPASM domain